MTFKLKPITETSWLLIGEPENINVGLITRIRDEYTLMISGEKQKFLSKQDLNKFFNEDIFKNLVREQETEDKDYFVRGFPASKDEPNEVIVKGIDLPLFSKKESSEIYYCAGYYCLNFPKNWMPAFCPKLSTLKSYEYLGPFKTEFEMRAELTKARRQRKAKL